MAKIWEPISRGWMRLWLESNSFLFVSLHKVRVSWRGPFFFSPFLVSAEAAVAAISAA
jgi:hypothetical protein